MLRPAQALEVTVVIPTRNRLNLLSQTLAHVLGQAGVLIEVLVVDDGSTDGTPDWVRSLGDERVTLLESDGRGVAAARNLGLQRARAPFVAFNDDDDLWAPHKLEVQLLALRGDTAARWICSGAIRFNNAMELIGTDRVWTSGDVLATALVANPVPGGASGVVADTELVREVGGFDGRFQVLADWDLWVRLAQRGPMAAANRPLHAYRIHGGTMSGATAGVRVELELFLRKYQAARDELGVELNVPRLECWMADRAQRAGNRVAAAVAFSRGARVLGRWRSIGRVAEALLWPSGVVQRDRRRGQRVDPAWRAEVESWLPLAPERSSAPRGISGQR